MVTDDKGGNPPPAKAKRVEVLVDNLGPDLLKKGTVTDDPKVVALLKKQKADRPLVREVE